MLLLLLNINLIYSLNCMQCIPLIANLVSSPTKRSISSFLIFSSTTPAPLDPHWNNAYQWWVDKDANWSQHVSASVWFTKLSSIHILLLINQILQSYNLHTLKMGQLIRKHYERIQIYWSRATLVLQNMLIFKIILVIWCWQWWTWEDDHEMMLIWWYWCIIYIVYESWPIPYSAKHFKDSAPDVQ